MFRNVAVFDFRSLYPSIMRTFNIDPFAYEQALLAGPALKNPLSRRTVRGLTAFPEFCRP
jgi:DNA polymerase-2